MATAGAGSVDVAKALIEAHANINATNDYGAMALDIAVAGHGTSSDIAVLYLLGVGGKGREPAPGTNPATANTSTAGGY